jgi:hypothetical protein
MAQTDAVFTGKVTYLTTLFVTDRETKEKFPTRVEATVQVTKSIKGHVHGDITVTTGTGGGDCGYDFVEGESYLFYAYKGKDGRLSTNICTRTQPLQDAGDEILELAGRLPRIKTPAHDPVIQLKGKINDAGYNGYVFVLSNRLHGRIFYMGQSNPYFIQVKTSGKWSAYPANYFESPREELSDTDAMKALQYQRLYRANSISNDHPEFINRLSSGIFFTAIPTSTKTWRMGIQYVTEQEFDAGKKIPRSKHIVWSEPINEQTVTRELTFDQAFRGGNFIPDPAGKP